MTNDIVESLKLTDVTFIENQKMFFCNSMIPIYGISKSNIFRTFFM